MYNIDLVKDFRIYRGKIRLFPDATGDRKKNTLLLLGTNSFEESLNILSDENIDRRIFFSYHYPLKETITTNVKKIYRFNQQENYNRVKTQVNNIRLMRKELKDYKQANLIYDLSYLNEAMFNSINSIPNRKKSQLYANAFSEIRGKQDLNSYNKIYMIIPLDKAYKSVSQEIVKADKMENILSVLFNLALYNPLELEKFNNITGILYCEKNNIFIKFNLSMLDKSTISRLAKLIDINSKLIRKENLTQEEEQLLELSNFELYDDVNNSTKDRISSQLKGIVYNNFDIQGLTGDIHSQELVDKIENIIDNEVEKTANITPENSTRKTKQVTENLEDNEELKQYLEQLKDERLKAAKASKMTKRDELLRENQKKLKVKGDQTLEDILNEYNDKKIERRVVENDLLAYDYAKSSTIIDFEKSYNEKQMLKDQLMVLECFSSPDKDIQLYIKDIQREDSSDEFNIKETLTVIFEDSKRVRHTVKVDVPKMVDEKFMYINGNKKGIVKQLFLKPVVKTGRDEVQVVSNYNKAFITRYGQNVSPKLGRLKKLLLENKMKGVSVKAGNCQLANTEYLTNIEYNDLSTNVQSIEIGDSLMLSFNQSVIRNYFSELKIDVDTLEPHLIPIGINKKTPIILNIHTNCIEGTNKELSDFILDSLIKQDPSVLDIVKDIKVGKRYMYSRASVLSKKIPLVIFLAYKDGLSTVLRKAGIKHEFSDKRKTLSFEEKNNKGVIQFADGYLIYDMYPYRNSLLMNGFLEVDCRAYTYDMFDSKEVYLEIFNEMLGTRTIGKGLDNFFQLFLDPITLEVLNDLNMPTDFVELFLYANALLEDNMFVRENDMSNYRIRSNEIINVYLYNILAKAYATYKDTANASNPIKVSVPQDKLIKEIQASVLVEDVNILNPVIEGTVNCTYKGPSGLVMFSSL